ncbi:jg27569 [Pararge aegeria aegeria]|uniref:Jg27569 protein n=1 Tax=Pararge aegeria aegeria TaxID=348720 RepID=A0A8S4SJN2_9NEOP|nr:jg27569 [Pararge aegeria aegeria]
MTSVLQFESCRSAVGEFKGKFVTRLLTGQEAPCRVACAYLEKSAMTRPSTMDPPCIGDQNLGRECDEYVTCSEDDPVSERNVRREYVAEGLCDME